MICFTQGIPYEDKYNIAAKFADAAADIVPNWLEATSPSVSIGKRCEPFKVDTIRGYLTDMPGKYVLVNECFVVFMPEGMVENQKFDEPVITPTTKAEVGHDEDISREEILAQG